MLIRLELAENHHDLTLFNMAIDSKPRGCDLVFPFEVQCTCWIEDHGLEQPLADKVTTPFAPPFPTIVQRLVRSIGSRGNPPPQTIAVDEDNPAQNTPVIDTRLAVGLREEGLQTRHLRICQPEEIRHVHRIVFEP